YGGSVPYNPGSMSLQLGLVHLGILIASLFSIPKLKTKTRKQVFFWLLLILWVLAFTNQLTQPFWNAVRPMQFIQYPWRYLLLASISISVLSAVLIHQLPIKFRKIAASSLMVLGLVLYGSYMKPNRWLDPNSFKVNES